MLNHMKLWGWGDPNKKFDAQKRPYFDAFIKKVLNLDQFEYLPPKVDLKNLILPPIKMSQNYINNLQLLLTDKSKLSTSDEERALHSYGKSFRDLFRARNGYFSLAPDLVIYPQSTKCVKNVLKYCHQNNIQVIPFGGGTNIVGGVEVIHDRPTVSLDLKFMNQVLCLDKDSHVAQIQAGILGPQIEEQLQNEGFTLGHYPDSFEFSSLGGWIATRSAGMQSDKYGKIEDMVLALTLVTPIGEIKTLNVPASSIGIDMKHLLIGSEGILGVITEALLKVHKKPQTKIFNGYIFPDFKSGMLALKECSQNGIQPVINRLNDNAKTQMSMAFKEKEKGMKKKILSQAFQKYMIQIKKYQKDQISMCLTAFEGSKKQVEYEKNRLEKIYQKYGALSLGHTPGATFEETKYDFPYVRDYIMDLGIIADVSETSTTWNNLIPLYQDMFEHFNKLEHKLSLSIFLSCHISHTYHSGASLYFTWACPQHTSIETLDLYQYIKDTTENVFINNKATLSHHHATGYEHKKWIKKELGDISLIALKALKKSIDPHNIMNQGKVF